MPADQPKPDKPKKSRPPSPPRRKNRFNEREFARAGRAGKAIGAHRVTLDPATGVYTMFLSDGTLAPPATEWDAATEKLKTDAATEKLKKK
jgi:hypothetical protein